MSKNLPPHITQSTSYSYTCTKCWKTYTIDPTSSFATDDFLHEHEHPLKKPEFKPPIRKHESWDSQP